MSSDIRQPGFFSRFKKNLAPVLLTLGYINAAAVFAASAYILATKDFQISWDHHVMPAMICEAVIISAFIVAVLVITWIGHILSQTADHRPRRAS